MYNNKLRGISIYLLKQKKYNNNVVFTICNYIFVVKLVNNIIFLKRKNNSGYKVNIN